MKAKNNKLSYRFEQFGGIIASEAPPFLAHVDKAYMEELGAGTSSLWAKPEQGYLSAPLEVHFSVTNQCSAGCKSCYMDSGEKEKEELSSTDFKKAIDLLSEMNVFHIALGGGEAFEREDFFEIVEYARQKGLVPNLTTNGYLITSELAEKCRIFGQVNVSLDGTGEAYNRTRIAGGFQKAKVALENLKKAGVRCGINCMVTNQNFSHLKDIFKLANQLKLEDIEFLRYKPSGRGKNEYRKMRLTDEQNKNLFPALTSLSKKYKVKAKIDCSFIPMLCWHKPDREIMEKFSVYGCEAGNVLLGIRADGRFAGCSFCSNDESVFDLKEQWHTSKHLSACRNWVHNAPEPCRSCDYLDVCKGGCHAVSEFVTGEFAAPDPECPFVVSGVSA